jgi:hypothetical protein
MTGCLKNLLAGVGCVTLLIVGAVLGYHYRAQLKGLAESVAGRHVDATPPADSVGGVSERALRAARRKEAAMAERGGPASVTLTAAELASLIGDGLDPVARRALDSLRVVLTRDRFAVEAQLVTTRLDTKLFGPVGFVLAPREPLRMAGPASVASPGRVAWKPDEVVLRAFPFPPAVIPRLVNAILSVTDGAVPIVVPETVGDLRIRPDGVTFYRRTR